MLQFPVCNEQDVSDVEMTNFIFLCFTTNSKNVGLLFLGWCYRFYKQVLKVCNQQPCDICVLCLTNLLDLLCCRSPQVICCHYRCIWADVLEYSEWTCGMDTTETLLSWVNEDILVMFDVGQCYQGWLVMWSSTVKEDIVSSQDFVGWTRSGMPRNQLYYDLFLVEILKTLFINHYGFIFGWNSLDNH